MAEDSNNDYSLNLSRIKFPSDRVTLRQIRQEQPEIIFSDRELLNADRRLTHILAIEMMRTEHILARKAWTKAVGSPDPYPAYDRLEAISFLDEDYQRYGLSPGPKGTLELVRLFEDEAVREAQKASGRILR